MYYVNETIKKKKLVNEHKTTILNNSLCPNLLYAHLVFILFEFFICVSHWYHEKFK